MAPSTALSVEMAASRTAKNAAPARRSCQCLSSEISAGLRQSVAGSASRLATQFNALRRRRRLSSSSFFPPSSSRARICVQAEPDNASKGDNASLKEAVSVRFSSPRTHFTR
ncbi:hypothetical protein D3C87_1664280 [compost metagenome]